MKCPQCANEHPGLVIRVPSRFDGKFPIGAQAIVEIHCGCGWSYRATSKVDEELTAIADAAHAAALIIV